VVEDVRTGSVFTGFTLLGATVEDARPGLFHHEALIWTMDLLPNPRVRSQLGYGIIMAGERRDPWGGVCHGASEEETYRELCALVADEVEQPREAGKELPPARTRPMREAVPA